MASPSPTNVTQAPSKWSKKAIKLHINDRVQCVPICNILGKCHFSDFNNDNDKMELEESHPTVSKLRDLTLHYYFEQQLDNKKVLNEDADDSSDENGIEVQFTYFDEENESILFSSDLELSEALEHSSIFYVVNDSDDDEEDTEEKELLLKNQEEYESYLHVTATVIILPSSPSSSSSGGLPNISTDKNNTQLDPNFIHARHACDNCKLCPIVGYRYHAIPSTVPKISHSSTNGDPKSSKFSNFDLCHACYIKWQQRGSLGLLNLPSGIKFEPVQYSRDKEFPVYAQKRTQVLEKAMKKLPKIFTKPFCNKSSIRNNNGGGVTFSLRPSFSFRPNSSSSRSNDYDREPSLIHSEYVQNGIYESLMQLKRHEDEDKSNGSDKPNEVSLACNGNSKHDKIGISVEDSLPIKDVDADGGAKRDFENSDAAACSTMNHVQTNETAIMLSPDEEMSSIHSECVQSGIYESLMQLKRHEDEDKSNDSDKPNEVPLACNDNSRNDKIGISVEDSLPIIDVDVDVDGGAERDVKSSNAEACSTVNHVQTNETAIMLSSDGQMARMPRTQEVVHVETSVGTLTYGNSFDLPLPSLSQDAGDANNSVASSTDGMNQEERNLSMVSKELEEELECLPNIVSVDTITVTSNITAASGIINENDDGVVINEEGDKAVNVSDNDDDGDGMDEDWDMMEEDEEEWSHATKSIGAALYQAGVNQF